jgi:hypothetical protein
LRFRDTRQKFLEVLFEFGILLDLSKQPVVEPFLSVVEAELLPHSMALQPFALQVSPQKHVVFLFSRERADKMG